MFMKRSYFVEGLQGAGKTTFVQRLFEMILELVGIVVTVISIWQTRRNKRHQKSNRSDQS